MSEQPQRSEPRVTSVSKTGDIRNGAKMSEQLQELEKRITDYLSSGGLFNPELMEHNKVRELIIDCRDALAAEQPPATEQEWTADMIKSYYGSERQLADKINAALAIQRQAVVDAMSLSNEMCEKLEQQLAAANRSRDMWEETAKKLDKQLAAEREKRNPLVDALEEIETWRHPWDSTHPCSQIADIAKGALAKVNQVRQPIVEFHGDQFLSKEG